MAIPAPASANTEQNLYYLTADYELQQVENTSFKQIGYWDTQRNIMGSEQQFQFPCAIDTNNKTWTVSDNAVNADNTSYSDWTPQQRDIQCTPTSINHHTIWLHSSIWSDSMRVDNGTTVYSISIDERGQAWMDRTGSQNATPIYESVNFSNGAALQYTSGGQYASQYVSEVPWPVYMLGTPRQNPGTVAYSAPSSGDPAASMQQAIPALLAITAVGIGGAAFLRQCGIRRKL